MKLSKAEKHKMIRMAHDQIRQHKRVFNMATTQPIDAVPIYYQLRWHQTIREYETLIQKLSRPTWSERIHKLISSYLNLQ